ncbi:MAG: tetratricopeptide repeat protein [Bryobacterales bacterium]|nr:tetratricopeptide repeat protein [Bryobacterales bacterium]
MARPFLAIICAAAASCAWSADAQQDRRPLQDAIASLRAGDAARAAELANEALDGAAGPAPAAYWVRAQARTELGDYQAAATDYERLARIEPNSARASLELGAARFRNGDMAGSISAFERVIELESDSRARLWQLGISQYYAGDFAGCAALFESHRTVNPQDVENSVWHFLCGAAARGFKAAREGIIPVDRDSRVPMKEIFALFSGSGSARNVLDAAASVRSGGSTAPAFYAQLYLGLYYEASGDAAKSAEHIAHAVRLKQIGNYMWQVSRMHQKIRQRSE